MLPSQGLFRSIPCPFYLAGLCERPHCSYRHCRSDIRIDRKLETEALDDPSLEEGQVEGLPPSSGGGASSLPPTKDVAAVSSSKEPVVNVNSKISITEKTVGSKATERLKTAEAVPTVSRKRSYEKDGGSLNKRRRVSEEGSGKMGSPLSTMTGSIAGACQSALKSCLPKSTGETKTDTLPDIDDLVREIENAGKPSESQRRQSDHDKRKKSKKHKHHRHRDSDSSSVSTDSPSKDKRHSSSSHRKENKSNEEDRRSKDKARSDSTRDGHSYKRESSSKSSSVKDSRSHRKSSSSSETQSSRKDRKSDGSHSSPKKERKLSGSSSGKGSSDSAKEVCKPTSPTVDISNRFNALAESSADDESAYNSDIFEDTSLNYDGFVGGSDSEEDPEIVARECLEMFENYKPDEKIKPVQKSAAELEKKEDGPAEGFCMVGKKRVAHSNPVIKTSSISATPLTQKKAPATSKNLQETLIRRFEDQSTIRTNTQNGSSSTFTPPAPAKPVGKSRIAHVPNAGKLAQKPNATSSTTKISSSTANTVPGRPGALTYSQTAAKGVPRAAHKPSTTVTSKPGPSVFRDAVNKTSKIPHNTRQTIMDKMYAEYVRILEDEEKAFQTTVKHENELLGKCSSKQVYYSSGISAISGLRKTNKPDGSDRAPNSRVMSHEHLLTGSLESRNCSVRVSKKDVALPEGNKLYKALLRYLMTEKELQENGYPRPHPTGENGRVTAKPRQGDNNIMTLTNRVCERCKKRYKTTEDGVHEITEVCNYHWGRKYNMMSRMGRGIREATYSCCGSDDDRIGCVTAPCHVSKSPIPLDAQKGFVCAVYGEANVEEMGLRPWDIIGIDCEMVYTTHGNELARVTVTSVTGEVLYDEIVKPTHQVLDANTRFSGLTLDDLAKATQTITEVQAVLLTYLRPNTITIGHSLESDLIALRVRHDYVIDTALLYPHRMGPPKKRALKTLSVEILQKVIQDSDSGHDSAEDARIAVELVLAKLKSDMASK